MSETVYRLGEFQDYEVVWRGDLHREIPPPPPYRVPDLSYLIPAAERRRRGRPRSHTRPFKYQRGSMGPKVLAAFAEAAANVHEIAARTGYTVPETQQAIYRLGMAGKVKRVATERVGAAWVAVYKPTKAQRAQGKAAA